MRMLVRLQPESRQIALVTLASLAALGLVLAPRAHAADPLPSWTDGAAKRSIVEFVAKVTKEGGPDFVPPAERIATFDNDGTLWAEQPLYFQFLFALDRVKALAPQHPEWKDREPFASLLKGDLKGALAGGEKALLELVTATHSGMTTGEFEQIVKAWLATAVHPTFRRPYTDLAYQPMLELLAYSARERLQDVHRLWGRRGVHARLRRASLWHSPRASHWQHRQTTIRAARR
jgi:hypothetical protein